MTRSERPARAEAGGRAADSGAVTGEVGTSPEVPPADRGAVPDWLDTIGELAPDWVEAFTSVP